MSVPPPPSVTNRLEEMFDAVSELGEQPHVAAAFELACDALQRLLPSEVVGAALYHIDSDELRFVTARGPGLQFLPDAPVARRDLLSDGACDHGTIISGSAAQRSWVGATSDEASALMCPIAHEGHLLGLLVLTDPHGATGFTSHDLDLVRYVAAQLGSFIHEQRHRSSSATPAF